MTRRVVMKCFALSAALMVSHSAVLSADTPASALPAKHPPPAAKAPPPVRDGQHDFDFEAGTWKIHLRRLQHPLTGSTSWVEFDGTSVTRQLWNGRAEIEEFETDGAAGHIEGLTLRLYSPQSHQWSLFWANSKDGRLDQPMIGEFNSSGSGEFYQQDVINGRTVLVRFIWSGITPNSAHFEQAFSADGGKTWEVNWITDQTRVPDDTRKAHSNPKPWSVTPPAP
jgi:hypothetical protein